MKPNLMALEATTYPRAVLLRCWMGQHRLRVDSHRRGDGRKAGQSVPRSKTPKTLPHPRRPSGLEGWSTCDDWVPGSISSPSRSWPEFRSAIGRSPIIGLGIAPHLKIIF